jgi:predicted metal-dependent hydrolase
MHGLLERGIHLFNSRQYFECHEVWEKVWTPERGPRRLFLQSLIHFAVGLYHSERGNPVGAARQLRKGLRKLGGYLPSCEGIDTARLHAEGLMVLERIEAGAAFEHPQIHLSENSIQMLHLTRK